MEALEILMVWEVCGFWDLHSLQRFGYLGDIMAFELIEAFDASDSLIGSLTVFKYVLGIKNT